MALFESLSSKLAGITAKMRGKSRVTEQDITDMMKEIRLALLEADVNLEVVRQFIDEVSLKSKGAEIFASLNPGQQIVKIVHDTLTEILGKTTGKIIVSPSGFTILVLCGLQGSGKTTMAAKLGLQLKKKGKKPMVASVDVHRPAAARQLEILAEQAGIKSFIMPDETDAVVIAKKAVDRARYMLCDTLIIDTAGRTTLDREMMQELKEVTRAVNPTEKLLVVDAMIGQEAVNVAIAFNEAVGIDGFIMTKLDSDARGGAALSIHKMTGKPIKMVGVGEKIEDIEEFHPDRMASRILGMGDVMTLIEKSVQQYDETKAKEAYSKIKKNQFSLEDMLTQFEEVQKMGPIENLLGMIPGMNKKAMANTKVDEKAIPRSMAIIRSMTKKERNNPSLLNANRRKRIAAGSGTTVQDVNRLMKQFEDTQVMMKRFGGMSKGKTGGFGANAGFPF
ncbi:MAG: signal recognition particle protein [Saccharofermentanales bacterium]